MVMETCLENIAKDDGSSSSRVASDLNVNVDRKIVSYRDICLGSDSDDPSESFDEEGGSNNGDESQDEELESNIDKRCPVVKISKEERKQACQPWKHSMIVKLLEKGLE
ncbi:hypothetical protein SESBI_23504 [Sesbania bispinosa]|nr:hypothetical protein SESBI_23504 [Sesbania bispinosa]